MRKWKWFIPKVVAFSVATLLTCSGMFDNLTLLSMGLTGNVSGTVRAEAATMGTVNADTFSWDNATVYFLLTDRFKNGNTANDHSYNRGLDQNGNVIQGADERGTFHGGDFAGITQAIEEGYFEDLGVNALWISAAYEQIHGYIVGDNRNPSFAHYSYHGYYVLDYTQTDANFGTEEEFKTLVDTAHEHGLRVVMDVVMNHAGYNSLYDMNEYGFGTVKSGWDDYYYPMKNVNNASYHSYIDYEGSEADWGNWWGPDWIRCGLPGYTAGGGDSLTMSLAGLPDFKTESTATVGIPKILETKWKQEGRYDEEVNALNTYLSSHGYDRTVTNCISYWLSSWVREYGIDGFRCDTAKHVDLASWKTLKTMCTEALREWKAANPDKALDDLDFWMTGECWNHNVGYGYDEYFTSGGFDSMINFETQGGGILSKETVASKYDEYAAAINSNDKFNALSYIASHDSVLANGDRKYLGSALLLLPGGVQVYYGDETNRGLVPGMPFDGNGGAGHSLRSDMNWDNMDEDVLAHWQKVGQFRNNHIAVGAGQNTSLTATSGVAFGRTYSKGDISDRIIGVIGADENVNVTIDVAGIFEDGAIVINAYDSSSAIVTNGEVTFNSGANGTILIQDPDGKPIVNFEGDAKFQGTQTVTARLSDCEQAIVSVDGAKKFIVKDGDQFVIGETAYDGDTVTISYEATNEKGTVKGNATFTKSGGSETIQKTGIVHIKMADGSAPYVYAWSDSSIDIVGAWPGTQLTEKDSDGNYMIDLGTTEAFCIIINGGSDSWQTGDITGLKGEKFFEVASDHSYKAIPVVESKYALLKQAARAVKNLTKSDYTEASYNALYAYIPTADSLIALGESDADITAVETAYNNVVAAQAALVLAKPVVTSAISGSKDVKGTAPYGARVTATIDEKQYTATADEITGVWSVIAQSNLTSPSVIKTSCTRDGLKSEEETYSLSGGDIKLTGWQQANGKWYYYDANGKIIIGWLKDNEKWYYMDSDGVMQTGWFKDGGSWYYLESNGKMATGWKSVDGKWYFFETNGKMAANKWVNTNYYVKANGVMATDEWVDGERYYVDADGKWVPNKTKAGWKKNETGWWYDNGDGTYPKSTWKSIDGDWYYFNASGYIVTGWFADGGSWYYFESNGKMATGWRAIGGKWYYLEANGKMAANKWINSVYYVKADGSMAVSEWVDGNRYYVGADGKWIPGKTA